MELRGFGTSSAGVPVDQKQLMLTVLSQFVSPEADVYSTVKWEHRTVEITKPNGEVVFRGHNLEFPATWSQNCAMVTAEKYFRYVPSLDTKVRETSVRQMISRVAGTIARWGVELGYFPDVKSNGAKAAHEVFRDELSYILLHQIAAFNSPVWFNVGTSGGALRAEQCSACFIVGLEDTMTSILELAEIEGRLYKGGSGSGVNYSKLRSSREGLSGGGMASGPVPFIAKDDFNAGAIKSGGTTRRAAKMAILNIDHGDILEFIRSKAQSEKAAHALIDAGFEGDFRARWGAYQLVPFQNANHSVRVTDEFMRRVESDADWNLMARDGKTAVLETVKARMLWEEICKAAHVCGDPGLQFDTTINRWHTCPTDGRIEASNPCCFVGETLVETSEGRIPIGQLADMEKLPLALSYDFETRLPVAKQIKKAWKAGETTSLVKVTTERGLQFTCTPEHHWYLRNGSSVEAQRLKPGMRLMKLSFTRNVQRNNRRTINHRVTETSANGTEWFNRWLWEQVNGSIPKGMQVHHRNNDATDDRLSNYELTTIGSHQSEHSTGARNPRFISVEPCVLVEAWEALESTGPVTVWRWNSHVRDHGLLGSIPIAHSRDGGRIHGMSWTEFSDFIEAHRADVNDKVASVEFLSLDMPVSVYDIEVVATHNFGIACPGFEHAPIVSNSEYMYLNDTACNLASINLLKFLRDNGSVDVKSFEHVIDVMITAQEILVDGASYPTPLMQANSSRHRTLGIGYSNLGAFLMAQGLAYDSNEARAQAAYVTAILSGRGYARSAEIAEVKGAFDAYNESDMLRVMRMHQNAVAKVSFAEDTITGPNDTIASLADAATDAWARCLALGSRHGYRNGQISVLAPAGTISFLMDCDTTGIEPELSLIKVKKLVGGGTLTMTNQQVIRALGCLGYDETTVGGISQYVLEHGSTVGAPGLDVRHQPVFDSSFPDPVGGRFLRPQAHILMMSAVQPFVSGAISKTCNIPNDATEQQISDLYQLAWRKGLKAVALYRDGSKRTQPLQSKTASAPSETSPVPLQTRKKLPADVMSHRHKFSIGGHEGYIHVGLYSDGKPGEIFIKMSKEGSTVSGLMDAVGVLTSLCLQYGVPLEVLVDKFSYTSFEPAGMTEYAAVRFAKSPLDYLFRWLGSEFSEAQLNQEQVDELAAAVKIIANTQEQAVVKPTSGFVCGQCGNPAQRAGACLTCRTCGWSQGCG